MLNMGQNWDWTKLSDQRIPTAEERAANVEAMRRSRHDEPCCRILMQYEKLFDVWRVTFSENGRKLYECRFEHDHTLEETVRRGRALTCLADRQALELGMSHGQGAVILQLDAQQYGALTTPR